MLRSRWNCKAVLPLTSCNFMYMFVISPSSVMTCCTCPKATQRKLTSDCLAMIQTSGKCLQRYVCLCVCVWGEVLRVWAGVHDVIEGSTEAHIHTGNIKHLPVQTACYREDVPHCLCVCVSPESRWCPVEVSHEVSFHPKAIDALFTHACIWEALLLKESSLSAPSSSSPICPIIQNIYFQ